MSEDAPLSGGPKSPRAEKARSTQAAPARAGLRAQAERLAEALPPLLVEAERVANTVAQGVHGRRRSGAGESFWQYRRYRAGDAAQRIDWRQSGKSSKLYVRETEWEAAETLWLWRDASASMDYRSSFAQISKKDRATVLGLALANLLVRGGERVAALGSGIPPATNRMGLRRLAHHYLSEEESLPESLPPGAHVPPYAAMVFLSDFLSPPDALAKALQPYAHRGIGGHMVQIIDPAEADLPFEGRTEFVGVEDPRRLLVGKAESLRSAYHRRLEEHQDALRQIARRLGWHFTVHRTDRPAETCLLSLYGQLAGMNRGPGRGTAAARQGG